jgi:hypothetical protein
VILKFSLSFLAAGQGCLHQTPMTKPE